VAARPLAAAHLRQAGWLEHQESPRRAPVRGGGCRAHRGGGLMCGCGAKVARQRSSMVRPMQRSAASSYGIWKKGKDEA
jgi:hypothetical protein